MRKLPASAAPIVLPLILTMIMTAVVSGISTYLALGLVPGVFMAWGKAWLTSLAVAFPVMVFVLPVARSLVARLVDGSNA